MPNISGSSSSPLAVADAPWTYCMYCGRKFTAPNIAAPTRKLRIWAMVKLRLRNSRGGRIGSDTRPSAYMNAGQREDAHDGER